MRASPRVSCRCSALARFSDAALRRLRAQAKRDSWLLNQAIEFYSCFISYSHAEKPFAYRLHDTLQSRGIRCWLDEHQVLPGDDIYDQVDRGIRLWDKVLLCCSKESLTTGG